MDTGRVTRLSDDKQNQLRDIARLCKNRRKSIVISLFLVYWLVLWGMVAWYRGAMTSYTMLLVIAAIVMLGVFSNYRTVKQTENHPILGYLLMIRAFMDEAESSGEQLEARRRDVWKRKVEFPQATSRPGFADDAAEDIKKSCGYNCPDCPEDCMMEKDEATRARISREHCDFLCDRCPPVCSEGECPL